MRANNKISNRTKKNHKKSRKEKVMDLNINDHVALSMNRIIEAKKRFYIPDRYLDNNKFVDCMFGSILAILSNNGVFQSYDWENFLTPFMQKWEAFTDLGLDAGQMWRWRYDAQTYNYFVEEALLKIEDMNERERLAGILNFDLNEPVSSSKS